MYTTTRMDADGVLDESQLTENLGHEATVEGGTVITSATGTLTGSDDVIDLSDSATMSSSRPVSERSLSTTAPRCGRHIGDDKDDVFETILTGAGDDLLIGLDGVSEVFNPGTGSNTVLAGNEAGDYDELDYSQMSGPLVPSRRSPRRTSPTARSTHSARTGSSPSWWS